MCNKEPYTTTLRISGELRNQLKRIAKIEHKTLNGLITKILIEAVTNYNLYR
jgi:predicted HicB family RNase H-like nuclease